MTNIICMKTWIKERQDSIKKFNDMARDATITFLVPPRYAPAKEPIILKGKWDGVYDDKETQ